MDRRTFIVTAALACTGGCIETRFEPARAATEIGSESSNESVTLSSTNGTQMAIGDSYAWTDQVSIAVESVCLREAVRLDSGLAVRSSPGSALLLAEIHDSGSNGYLPPTAQFELVSDGTRYEVLDPTTTTASNTTPEPPAFGPSTRTASDTPLDGSKSVWIMFEVPRNITTVRLSVAEYGSNDPRAYWTGTVDPSSLSQTEIRSIDIPATHENGAPIQCSITVTNTGESVDQFSQRFFVERTTTQTGYSGDLTATVDPGETVTIKESIDAQAVQELTVTIPRVTKQTVRIVPATIPFGEFHTVPNGVRVRIEKPILADSVTVDRRYDSYQRSTNDTSSYVVFAITARNATRSRQSAPTNSQLTAETTEFIDTSPNDGTQQGLTKPVDQPFYRGGTEIGPGETIRGVLYYRLPAEVSGSDVMARWEFPTDEQTSQICTWRDSD